MLKKPESVLFRITAIWTVIGLAGGLTYRELTKNLDFSGSTQLAVVHTHTLVLGTLIGLGLLALERVYRLSRDRRFGWFLWIWNIGLLITVGGLTTKGTLQVLGSAAAESPALAGISGMGHILLTVGFLLLFLTLGRRIRDDRSAAAELGPADLGTGESAALDARS
ncbi:DUF2871 domain-containing protein [Microlunatus soli]|uniref:DUF2871 domain-containing protein n=1 Tax=Microlunatus soli TaxID=630515 RepID=A0A1H1U8R3_9ACTN|nr:DUF2871 domain-containing protein [Microlunatus soli]SDS68800.1 Protein of unknown function [Microlunatus soli]